MNSPPRHARFQIHLSTAILLMFVAGGLIWANVIGRRLETRGIIQAVEPELLSADDIRESEFFAGEQYKSYIWSGVRRVEHGWPFNAMQSHSDVHVLQNGETAWNSYDFPDVWRIGPIIYNALIALAILFAVWYILEWLIRRRAARNGA